MLRDKLTTIMFSEAYTRLQFEGKLVGKDEPRKLSISDICTAGNYRKMKAKNVGCGQWLKCNNAIVCACKLPIKNAEVCQPC